MKLLETLSVFQLEKYKKNKSYKENKGYSKII